MHEVINAKRPNKCLYLKHDEAATNERYRIVLFTKTISKIIADFCLFAKILIH